MTKNEREKIKKAISQLVDDDYVDFGSEDQSSISALGLILGRLDISIIRRKQMLVADHKALLELTK